MSTQVSEVKENKQHLHSRVCELFNHLVQHSATTTVSSDTAQAVASTPTRMSHSLLHAVRARASDTPAVSAGDATVTLRVGPERELLTVEKRLIPRCCSWSHIIPEQCDPAFARLVVQFWQEGARTTASAFTEFRVTFATFAESFAPGIEPPREGFWDGHPGALPGRAHPAAELVPQLNAAHARHLDQTRALRRSRLQLILRGACLDSTP